MELLGAMVGGLLLVWLSISLARQPGRALRAKFRALGPLEGRTYTQILLAVGRPTSTSHLADGTIVRRWAAAGYAIALRFTGERCEGVLREPWAR